MNVPEGDRSGVRVFPPLVFAVAAVAGLVLHKLVALPIASGEAAHPLRIAGAVCILTALAWSIWAVTTFRRIGTTANPAGGSTALALGGPYRFSRNPMYLGLALLQVGLALAADTLWPLLLLPVFVAIIRRAVIDPEERYLMSKFGAPYRDYTTRVRRWI